MERSDVEIDDPKGRRDYDHYANRNSPTHFFSTPKAAGL
jgi:hypothetical protein